MGFSAPRSCVRRLHWTGSSGWIRWRVFPKRPSYSRRWLLLLERYVRSSSDCALLCFFGGLSNPAASCSYHHCGSLGLFCLVGGAAAVGALMQGNCPMAVKSLATVPQLRFLVVASLVRPAGSSLTVCPVSKSQSSTAAGLLLPVRYDKKVDKRPGQNWLGSCWTPVWL